MNNLGICFTVNRISKDGSLLLYSILCISYFIESAQHLPGSLCFQDRIKPKYTKLRFMKSNLNVFRKKYPIIGTP